MTDLQRQVQAALDRLVESGAENGVQAAVHHRGRPVVDAVAGVADHVTGRPVTPDTPFYAASTGKGVAATVVHVLVDQGRLAYDTRIADLWPEFAANGKETATVRHALTHSVGVPAMPADLTLDRFADWDGMCELVAGLEPWWVPGEQVGYHAVTFGFILGEVVRRATGRPISQVLAEEVAGPLGVAGELFFGVPESEVHRLARFEDDPEGAAMFASLPPDFPLFKAGPRVLFPNAAMANNLDLLTHDVPSWGCMTARAVARMYAALLDEVGGVRLLCPARLKEATIRSTTGLDALTGAESSYGLGYTVGTIGQAAAPVTTFGMPGIGGSAAYADTATGISVAVTKNRFNPTEVNALHRVHTLAVEALA